MIFFLFIQWFCTYGPSVTLSVRDLLEAGVGVKAVTWGFPWAIPWIDAVCNTGGTFLAKRQRLLAPTVTCLFRSEAHTNANSWSTRNSFSLCRGWGRRRGGRVGWLPLVGWAVVLRSPRYRFYLKSSLYERGPLNTSPISVCEFSIVLLKGRSRTSGFPPSVIS